MQAFIARLRTTSGSVLTIALFAIVFGLGLAVFTLSGSIVVAALCMAMTSVTTAFVTREIFDRPDESHIRSVTQDETRQINRRISDIADRIVEIESEVRHIMCDRTTPERLRLDVMMRDVERISTILADVVYCVDANHASAVASLPAPTPEKQASRDTLTQAEQPILPTKAVPQKPANALAALQMENMLREDILNGKMKVHLHDIMNIESNRVALRKVECKLEGRLADFHVDHDLIKARISPGIIQLFDRMRFGFAYEFGHQFGMQAGSAPILCPLMDATFGNPAAADEIVATLESQQDLSRQLVLALDHSILSRPTPAEEDRLKRLQIAGTAIAAILSDDVSPDPDFLYQRGVRFAVINASFLLGRSEHVMRSAIHPADLASYLARHDIALIVQNVETLADLKSLKSAGVVYATGALFAQSSKGDAPDGTNLNGSANNRRGIKPPAIGKFDGINSPSGSTVAPLRDRLRRVRM